MFGYKYPSSSSGSSSSSSGKSSSWLPRFSSTSQSFNRSSGTAGAELHIDVNMGFLLSHNILGHPQTAFQEIHFLPGNNLIGGTA